MKRLAILIAVPALLVAGTAATAATSTSLARYGMNEGPRQHVLHDSVNGLDGIIGDEVVRNGRYLHFKQWPFHEPLDLEKTARVYSPDLNPNDSDFAVTWRMRTDPGPRFRNMMQKGQGSPAGGMFKFRITHEPREKWHSLQCFWRGSNGGSLTTTPDGVNYADGKWHRIRCAREDGQTTMRVDGKLVDTSGDPGTISNTWPLAIGGNTTSCEAVGDDGRHCNYFSGDIDWIRFSK